MSPSNGSVSTAKYIILSFGMPYFLAAFVDFSASIFPLADVKYSRFAPDS